MREPTDEGSGYVRSNAWHGHGRSEAEGGLNRDHARRDELLGTRDVRYSGGIKPFADVDGPRLTLLVTERFIDPRARQNESPSVGEFLRFVTRWPWATVHGYAVSRRRSDYRVSIEGLRCDLEAVPPRVREQLREEFRMFARGADESDVEKSVLWCWWD